MTNVCHYGIFISVNETNLVKRKKVQDMTPKQKNELKAYAKSIGYQIRVTKNLVAVSGCHYSTFKNDENAYQKVKADLEEAAIVFAERIKNYLASRAV